MAARGIAVCLSAVLLPGSALAQAAAPPDLDCNLGFEGVRAAVTALPGAQRGNDKGSDVVTVQAPDAWRVEYAFTTPGHAAHPAVTLRTLRKQVTGVWTSQSKGCGYGNQGQFAHLMADMKTQDSVLTNASRDEVERKKREASPLGGTP